MFVFIMQRVRMMKRITLFQCATHVIKQIRIFMWMQSGLYRLKMLRENVYSLQSLKMHQKKTSKPFDMPLWA